MRTKEEEANCQRKLIIKHIKSLSADGGFSGTLQLNWARIFYRTLCSKSIFLSNVKPNWNWIPLSSQFLMPVELHLIAFSWDSDALAKTAHKHFVYCFFQRKLACLYMLFSTNYTSHRDTSSNKLHSSTKPRSEKCSRSANTTVPSQLFSSHSHHYITFVHFLLGFQRFWGCNKTDCLYTSVSLYKWKGPAIKACNP